MRLTSSTASLLSLFIPPDHTIAEKRGLPSAVSRPRMTGGPYLARFSQGKNFEKDG
jgi:hypothetical protein